MKYEKAEAIKTYFDNTDIVTASGEASGECTDLTNFDIDVFGGPCDPNKSQHLDK